MTYGGSVLAARTNVVGIVLGGNSAIGRASSLQYDIIAGMLIRQPASAVGQIDEVLVEFAVQFVGVDVAP